MIRKLTMIFDLDGTLVDSFGQILSCAKRVRAELQMAQKSESELKSLVGLPAEYLFSDTSPAIAESAVAKFRAHLQSEIQMGNSTFPGSVELLSALKSRGVGTAIATSKPNYLAQLVVENSDLSKFVDFVQGVEGFAPKPDPQCILSCQSALPAKTFAMIGDRPEDIQAGLASGCFCVGIAQGSFEESDLTNAGAHETFLSIGELLVDLEAFLSRLNNYGGKVL